MQLKEIELLFSAGDLIGAAIVPAAMETGYQLQFDRRSNRQAPVVLDAKHRGAARVFKSIDTAIGIARKIGFRDVMVRLDSTK